MVEGGLHERSSRSRRALRNTPRSIGRVSLPVNVFCWLGWYEAISATPSAKVATAPCAKRGARRGRGAPRVRARRGGGAPSGRRSPAAAAPSRRGPHTGAAATPRRLRDGRRAGGRRDIARSRERAARERFAIRPDCDTVRAMPPQRDRVPAPRVPSIIVHGGAGADPVEGRDELRAGVRVAVLEGWRVLAGGGSALGAVERAVRALEDHPRFNAGRGSVLTSAGTVETDASIMEGDRLQCGAVAAVSRIANPVTLARRVMEASRHILLVGEGALAFARAQGLPECDPEALVTERQRVRHRELVAATKGTVGAVALDRHGTIAAATSTGGLAGQLPGRVGDSALIGCGTYAESSTGGVSCTGDGEAIIRVVLARRALDYLQQADDADYAARVAVDLLVEEGRGHGGLILLDWRGRMGWAHSTPLMPVALMSPAFAAPRVPF